MKLEAARAVIQASPRTHLGEAARSVLAMLDATDTARVEAAEAQQSVHIDALNVAREEAEQLSHQLDNVTKVVVKSRLEVFDLQKFLRASLDERDRLAAELEEAKKPNSDLTRLRSLETACQKLCHARPPMRAEGRLAFDFILNHIRPYLK